MTTRNQHYVWRSYLESWSREKDQGYCLRNGCLFPLNPKKIMRERDFYKLVPLTKEDIQFFDYWLKEKCETGMRGLNQETFDIFRVANANIIIQRMKNATDEEKSCALKSAIELEENLHGDIENRAIPIIKEFDWAFLTTKRLQSIFFNLLPMYFRTKRVREQIGEVLSR